MRVLKRVDHSDWRLRFDCRRCGSTLEAEWTDVKATFHPSCGDPREPAPSYHTYQCTCAVCNDNNVVAAEAIPRHLQYLIQEKTDGRKVR